MYLDKFKSLFEDYKDFDKRKIPLCAAETYTSVFTRQALNSILEGKYITGFRFRNPEKDFVGSDYLYQFLDLANRIAHELYGFDYNDFRCLSGMNTVDIILMSLFDKNSKILITGPEEGGHGSLPKICNALGIETEPIPYNYDLMQIDYDAFNDLLKKEKYDGIFFCQSDLIDPPDLRNIKCPEDTKIIYDATQTLGLIAGDLIESPVLQNKNVVMIGGTHKTFPSVTCGQISTNNPNVIDIIDKKISPDFLRNPQMNLIASVILTMIEMKEIGNRYCKSVVNIANKLGMSLEKYGIEVKKNKDGVYTNTHQIFIMLPLNYDVDLIYKRFASFFITINKRKTKYCHGFRVGVQEIARYSWESKIDDIALLLKSVINYKDGDREKIRELASKISEDKNDCFLINDIFMV